MPNRRRNTRSTGSNSSRSAFIGTLRRLGAVNFGVAGATRDANVTRFWVEDARGNRTEFNAPTDGGMSAINAKLSGAIRGSGSAVDKS